MRTHCIAQGTLFSTPCDLNGKEIQNREYIYMHSGFTFYFYSRHSIIKQLYSNKKLKKKEDGGEKKRA